MKRIFKAAVAAVGFTALATSAMAEWTPPGPIKLMIAFAAGGGADTQARMIAEELENKLGWKFIPEQVTGKGGMNLAMAMKDQPNDGTVIGGNRNTWTTCVPQTQVSRRQISHHTTAISRWGLSRNPQRGEAWLMSMRQIGSRHPFWCDEPKLAIWRICLAARGRV